MCNRIFMLKSVRERETPKGTSMEQSFFVLNDQMKKENKVRCWRAFIIVSESPSKSDWCIPISVAKITARFAANISNSSLLQGFPTFSAKAAMTYPDESRTTTPILASSLSLNIAPSKFILYSPGFGGIHLCCRLDCVGLLLQE